MQLRSGFRGFAHPRTWVLGLALTALAGAVSSTSPAVYARAAESRPEVPEGSVAGIPGTGEPGITETVAEIMERERLSPKVAAGEIEVAKPESSEWRRSLRLGRNPNAARSSRWPIGPKVARSPLPFNPQTVGTSFLGAQLSETGFIPPDSMGEVGPTQILVYVNGRIKVFDKAGNLGGLNVTTNTFFNSVRNGFNTSDPHVRYDRLSQRWFLTMINVPAGGPNRVMIAVSSGPTIVDTTSFTFFQFNSDQFGTPGTSLNGFADYDTLGVDKFALYIGVNMFNQAGSMFVGTTGYVVNKANLIAVSPTLTVTPFYQIGGNTCPSGAGPYSPQGVNNDDPSATEGYFIGVDVCDFDTLQIRRVVNPGGSPTISGNLTVLVPATSFPIDQVQAGTSAVLDALDDRLFAAAMHRNKITGTTTLSTAHNIQLDSSGGAVDCFPNPSCPGGRNGSRWYELGSLTSTPTLLQAGTVFDPAGGNPLGYWIPSVAISGQGHMALGSSRAGATVNAGIAVTGRLRGDAAGTTQAITVAQSSSSPYDVGTSSPRRWGDYSQVGVDPNDDQTMWTFQEYAIVPTPPSTPSTGNYAVRAIQLVAPPPATPASANPSALPIGQPSVSVVITGTPIAGSEFFDPGPNPAPPAQAYNHIAASVPGLIVNSVTFNSPTQVTLNVSTVGATAGPKNVTITNPDGQSRTGTALVNVNASLTINDVSMAEGNSGTTPFVFTVTLTPSSSQTVTVNYATANGTATAGSDYTATSGTLTFTAGQTTKNVTVNVIGDTVTEANETFFVNLSGATNAVIGDAQGVGTILNDDLPAISIADRAVPEGTGGTTTATFNVTLSAPYTGTVTVDYATAPGTATGGGTDYTDASGTLTFNPGVTSQPINVSINPDALPEANETFFVNLTNPTNATIADNQAVGTIIDDDSALVFFSLTPCRVVNTRTAQAPALGANTSRDFPTTGVCAIPSDAKAVAVIITTVNQTDFGDLRLYPTATVPPTASTINFAANHVRANNAIIPVGSGGQITVQCDMPPGSTGTTDFLMDVYGYFK